jgi:hypothetical protein
MFYMASTIVYWHAKNQREPVIAFPSVKEWTESEYGMIVSRVGEFMNIFGGISLFGCAGVTDRRIAPFVEQDVRRLQISMNNSPQADELHPKDDAHNADRLPCIVKLRQRPAGRKRGLDLRREPPNREGIPNNSNDAWMSQEEQCIDFAVMPPP